MRAVLSSTLPRPRKLDNSSNNDSNIKRPHTSIAGKRPRTSLKYSLAPGNNFGKDAPKFTIPSSRREEIDIFPLPGPGQYEISDINEYRKIKPVFPKSRPQTVIISPTANVEFSNYRSFPEIKDMHIFSRNKFEFYDVIESPGPEYAPKEKITQIPHKISCKEQDNSDLKNAHIGPGSYSLKYPYMPRDPAFNFYGPKRRDDWITDRRNHPGPGQYDPNDVKKREPQWTIGRKSRLSRRNKSLNPTTKKDLIAIDQCIIGLEQLANPSAARQYIMTHPQLREVVHEMIEVILNVKPDDPVAYLEDYFTEIKKFQPPKEKKGKQAR